MRGILRFASEVVEGKTGTGWAGRSLAAVVCTVLSGALAGWAGVEPPHPGRTPGIIRDSDHAGTADVALAMRGSGAPRTWQPGQVFRDCEDGCPWMVVIPEGRFMMGLPDHEAYVDPWRVGEPLWPLEGVAEYTVSMTLVYDRYQGVTSEAPRHPVAVPGVFAVGKFEVTFAQWDGCVADGGCGGVRLDDRGWGRGDRPVINVRWEDAKSYVEWLSGKAGKEYRLLSEAEWEYAARGGRDGKFHWGDEVGKNRANCNGCGSKWDGEKTAPVGSFPSNRYGLHDMHGNVSEWVEDCLHRDYRGAPEESTAWTTGGECRSRMLRGGSWSDGPRMLWSATRVWISEQYPRRLKSVGFRVARTLAP